MVPSLILTAALTLPTAPVSPVEQRYSDAFHRCMTSSWAGKGSDPAMTDCLSEEYARQDRVLNETYRRVLTRLHSINAQTVLRRSERRWIDDKLQECWSAGKEDEGGTLEKLKIASCFLDTTVRRTIWLESYR